MESLRDKYRPQSYRDVVGQADAVDALQKRVRTGEHANYLFIGDTGVGKTSLALITARAYRCSGDRNGILPCLHCAECKNIGEESRFEFENYSAPNLSIALLDDLLRTAGFLSFTGLRVIFIDEAHALRKSAVDKLLTVLESVRSTIFMFATDRPEELEPRLTKRLVTIRLRPLDLDVSAALLRKICANEGLTFTEGAIELIAEVSAGNARALIANLDEVSSGGELITVDLVRTRLGLDELRVYVPALVALVEDDLARCFQILNGIVATARAKAEALQTLSVQIYENAYLRLSRPGLESAGIERLQRERIVGGLRLISSKKSIDVDTVVSHMASQFLPENVRITDTWLKATLLRLKKFLHTPAEKKLRQLPIRQPARAAKQPRQRVLTPTLRYLQKSKVELIIESASQFTQATGQLFNFRLLFLHDRMRLDQIQGKRLVASCLHEMSMRIKAWSGGDEILYYIYVHQVSKKIGFNTTISGHVPIDRAYDIADWLDGFFHRSLPQYAGTRAVKLTLHRVEEEHARVRQHWRFLKSLCRSLDPNIHVFVNGRCISLVSLLKIPERANETLGPLVLPHPVRVSKSSPMGIGSQKYLPMLAAFKDGAWNRLQSGWELLEFADRRKVLKKLEAEIERIAHECRDDDITRELEMNALLSRQPSDPHERERSWRVWNTSRERQIPTTKK